MKILKKWQGSIKKKYQISQHEDDEMMLVGEMWRPSQLSADRISYNVVTTPLCTHAIVQHPTKDTHPQRYCTRVLKTTKECHSTMYMKAAEKSTLHPWHCTKRFLCITSLLLLLHLKVILNHYAMRTSMFEIKRTKTPPYFIFCAIW